MTRRWPSFRAIDEWRRRANEEARKRQEAAKPKPRDDGSLDAPLKSTAPAQDDKAAKKAQKQIEDYDKIVAKAREFIETQEIERQAMSMDAEAASALKHEHEMLNQAKQHGIELTDKQKAQIHDLANQMATAETATKNFQDMQTSLKEFGDTISGELTSALEGLVTGSTKLEDVWKRLALLFAKMALEAVLLGKGPLAGLFGTQGGGLLGGTAFGGSLGDAFAKLWDVQSTSLAPQLSEATRATSATPSAPASTTTPTAVSAVTPKITEAIEQGAQKAAEKATPNVPTPPSRPSDLTPSAPLPPRRPLLASDGLPAPIPPANIPHVAGGREAQAWNFFRSKGYSEAETSKILGNLKQESSFNPLSRNPNDAGPGLDSWGIAQWNRGRFSNLKSFAAKQGKPWQDYETQLGFVHHEIQGNPAYRNALRTRDGGGFGHAYEGFGDNSGPTRTRYSEDFLKKFGGRKVAEVDMTPTGSIAKQGQDAAKKAAEQASQAQQKLADQLTKASQTTQQIAAPLQSMDAGVGKLTGSLAQGVPATEGFAGELQKLIEQLLSGLGGGGGGLGGIGEALGGILGFASGGPVSGPGGPTSDSIPAFLSNGEYVVNAKAAGKHARLLDAINSGRAPRFAVGGFVGGDSFASAMTYAPSTSINIAGSGNARQDATLAQQAGDAVSAALAKHFRPDSFRRNDQQRMAAAFRAMSRAHSRAG